MDPWDPSSTLNASRHVDIISGKISPFGHSHVWLLQPHGWQQARLLRPSPPPRICSNSWPSSQWCYLRSPSPLALDLSQHQGLQASYWGCVIWKRFKSWLGLQRKISTILKWSPPGNSLNWNTWAFNSLFKVLISIKGQLRSTDIWGKPSIKNIEQMKQGWVERWTRK